MPRVLTINILGKKGSQSKKIRQVLDLIEDIVDEYTDVILEYNYFDCRFSIFPLNKDFAVYTRSGTDCVFLPYRQTHYVVKHTLDNPIETAIRILIRSARLEKKK